METDLLQKFHALRTDATSLVLSTENLPELNEIKLDFLGKSGRLTNLMKELAQVPAERRPEIGRLANEVKVSIEDLIVEQEKKLGAKTASVGVGSIDVSMPGILPPQGHLHLITQAISEISEIFAHIGFTRVRYPEVEYDWFAFGGLNFPENHPARDDWETFFMDEPAHETYGRMLLTPHTSSGQIREMTKAAQKLVKNSREPVSIKMLNIAKTYRRQSDVSHTPMFHQFETLCIGERISITHLKGVLDYFARSWFGEKRKIRIRPYHFQFTEPSFETDISCGVCEGKGCSLCKAGWLELGGAGMVHPNVIKNCGLDPKKYTGFASGWGVERVLMMREGLDLPDLRMLYSNDLRFLEQF